MVIYLWKCTLTRGGSGADCCAAQRPVQCDGKGQAGTGTLSAPQPSHLLILQLYASSSGHVLSAGVFVLAQDSQVFAAL